MKKTGIYISFLLLIFSVITAWASSQLDDEWPVISKSVVARSAAEKESKPAPQIKLVEGSGADAFTFDNVREVFDTTSPTVRRRTLLRKGQDVTSFITTLDNENIPFTQSRRLIGNVDIKAYDRDSEALLYYMQQGKDGSIGLKEWTYIRKPNRAWGSEYVWSFESDQKGEVLELQKSSGGFSVIARSKEISVIARSKGYPVIARSKGYPVIARSEEVSVIARSKGLSVIARSEATKQSPDEIASSPSAPRNDGISLARNDDELATLAPPTYWTRQNRQRQGVLSVDHGVLKVIIKEPRSSYPLLMDPTLSFGQWLGGKTSTNSSNWGQWMGGETTTDTLNWGQWLGGQEHTGAIAQVTALSDNGTTIYAGGYSNNSVSFITVNFSGVFNDVGGPAAGSAYFSGFVASITDNAGSPTLNWGQWLGGAGNSQYAPGDEILALINNGTTIYAGGYSASSLSWETVAFYGKYNNLQYYNMGDVIKITDNGSTPTLNWGQWLGGYNISSKFEVLALARNGTTVYAGGLSGGSISWDTVSFYGQFNDPNNNPSGFVVSMADNGASPTLNWGQWLGGGSYDEVLTLANNGTSVYAAGWSTDSLNWETVSFNGVFNDKGYSAGWVVSLTDNGATPTLNWGQWIGGKGNGNGDIVTSLVNSGTTVYAGGWSQNSLSWETVSFSGKFIAGNNTAGFVVKLSDSGSPTLNWGQWLAGTSNNALLMMSLNGTTIYAAGWSTSSLSWETVAFSGKFNDKGSSAGWVVSLSDSGATPTLNWGQWIGGSSTDQVLAVTHSGTTVYAGGFSGNSLSWETVTFTGTIPFSNYTAGFTVSITDNGTTPTLNWGQWMASYYNGFDNDTVTSLAANGSTIYAGGYSGSSLGWETVAFSGTDNAVTSAGFVVSMTDNGTSSTLNWGQWLGGKSLDNILALTLNGTTIYAGGISASSLSWETVAFGGKFNDVGYTAGFVASITDNGATPTLNWGQWEGGNGGANSGDTDSVTALGYNGTSIYAAGISASSLSWETVSVYGRWNPTTNYDTSGYVLKLKDNGSSVPTLSWLQWVGGAGANFWGDGLAAISLNGTTIYVGGFSTSSLSWETVIFGGNRNNINSGNPGSEAFVVSLSDNGSSPTLKWGQWLGGEYFSSAFALAHNGTTVYVGGMSYQSLSWETVNFGGLFNSTSEGQYSGFVVGMTDNGSSVPTLNWGQWLGGLAWGYSNQIVSLVNNGTSIYVGGFSASSSSWETVSFNGKFSEGATGDPSGFVISMNDNGSSLPTLNWGQWVGGYGNVINQYGDKILAMALSGSTIYAGGFSTSSVSWETVSFNGTYNDTGLGTAAFVVKLSIAAGTGNSNNKITALADNGTTIYSGGWSTNVTPWTNINFYGSKNISAGSASTAGFVLSLSDNGSSSVNWAQWLGGFKVDQVMALTNSGTSVYAGGWSTSSVQWQGVSFGGVFNDTTVPGTAGFVVTMADNGSSPTLKWGQWVGGKSSDEVLAMAHNGTSVYAGGYSTSSVSWETVSFGGKFNDAGSSGFVVSMADNGTTSTLNWGQWLGGTANDTISSLAHNGTTIYAGGWSTSSVHWETVAFGVKFNDASHTAGFVVSLTDNATSSSLNWGQWMGGISIDEVLALVNNGTTVYAGGWSTSSLTWESVNYWGKFNDSTVPGTSGFVASMSDNGSSVPTLNWGQWLGGTCVDEVLSLANSGTSVYAGGWSKNSQTWETVTFSGVYNDEIAAGTSGFVVNITDFGSSPSLNWGQWLGGESVDQVLALTVNGTSVYAGGYSANSLSWETIAFTGNFYAGSTTEGWIASLTSSSTGNGNSHVTALANNGTTIYSGGYSYNNSPLAAVTFTGPFNENLSGGAPGPGGFVLSMSDSTTPTVNWGQWMGGNSSDQISALTNRGTTIYVGGNSGSSINWETVTFYGNFNDTGSTAGFIVKLTDNGSTPALSWGQWIGGVFLDNVNAVVNNGTTIYVGGQSGSSVSWETVIFYGKFNDTTGNKRAGFVTSIADNGTTPTLNWGQWIGGTNLDTVLTISNNGSTVYIGGFSKSSISWQTVVFLGHYNDRTSSGYVVSLTDNGSTPTLNWAQWLGGASIDQVTSLANMGVTIYAGGDSNNSLSWETVSFYGQFNDGGGAAAGTAGYVVSITDNGSSSTLNWGQWLGGTSNDQLNFLVHNGTTIYAGGSSTSSIDWETVAFSGKFNDISGTAAWVISLSDNGATPTLNWGQWLGGDSFNDSVVALADNGTTIYAGGWGAESLSWETVNFSGNFYAGSTSEGWVVKLKDANSSSGTDALFYGTDF